MQKEVALAQAAIQEQGGLAEMGWELELEQEQEQELELELVLVVGNAKYSFYNNEQDIGRILWNPVVLLL